METIAELKAKYAVYKTALGPDNKPFQDSYVLVSRAMTDEDRVLYAIEHPDSPVPEQFVFTVGDLRK